MAKHYIDLDTLPKWAPNVPGAVVEVCRGDSKGVCYAWREGWGNHSIVTDRLSLGSMKHFSILRCLDSGGGVSHVPPEPDHDAILLDRVGEVWINYNFTWRQITGNLGVADWPDIYMSRGPVKVYRQEGVL